MNTQPEMTCSNYYKENKFLKIQLKKISLAEKIMYRFNCIVDEAEDML